MAYFNNRDFDMGWMHPSNPSTSSVFGHNYFNYNSMTATSCNPSPQHALVPTAANVNANHVHGFAQAQPSQEYNSIYQCLPPVAAAPVASQNISQQSSSSLYLHCPSEYSSMNAK